MVGLLVIPARCESRNNIRLKVNALAFGKSCIIFNLHPNIYLIDCYYNSIFSTWKFASLDSVTLFIYCRAVKGKF